jgi:hypothetical protein
MTLLPAALSGPERDQVYILTPAAAAATCTINEGGVGGVAVLNLSAPANGISVVAPPIAITNPYLAAIAGAGCTLTVLE